MLVLDDDNDGLIDEDCHERSVTIKALHCHFICMPD